MELNSISAASISAISNDSTRSDIGIKVARKALDAEQQQGEAAVELIQAAAQAGRNTSQGRVQGLDVTA